MPIIPPSDYGNAVSFCGVDVYPHFPTTAPVKLVGSQNGILRCRVDKSLREGVGTFSIDLAPGGPQGVNSTVTWTSIIQPMSLVVIYMARGSSRRIAMIGIVTSVSEAQAWNNKTVRRIINVSGADFTYYFTAFSFYLMTYLGLIQSGQFPVGTALGAAFAIGNFGGRYEGPPADMGYYWYKYVMVGSGFTSPACLENTFVTYNNLPYFLKQVFSYWFEVFGPTIGSGGSGPAYIPFLTDLMNSEGAWMDKFLSVFQFPFYEFFITTATANDYPQSAIALTSTSNSGFAANAAVTFSPTNVQNAGPVTGYASAFPMIVARVNPLPWVTGLRGGGGTSPGNPAIVHDRWDALPTFSLGNYGYISSEVRYAIDSTDDVHNFYAIQTSDSRVIASAAGSNDINTYAIEIFGALLDRFSINSYGYKPQFVNSLWFTLFDPSAAKGPIDTDYVSNTMLGMLGSYYNPIPTMLRGAVTFPLWPDIFIGNKFQYKPFRLGSDYLFYIEKVSHSYLFGGPSTTTIEATRGLKVDEYSDITGKLLGVYLNTYERINGDLVPRGDTVANPGLKYINVQTLAGANKLTSAYNFPGVAAIPATSPPPPPGP